MCIGLFQRAGSGIIRMVLCMLALTGVASAQSSPDGMDTAAVYSNAQRWLNENVTKITGDLPLRIEISVGELDRRLKLAACEQVETYIPVGSQLWGKSRLGLRCVKGVTKWNVFLPITVKAFGPAWVIKGQVAGGTVLTSTDAMAMEVDWAENKNTIVANAPDWLGQVATRTLSAGQAIRQDMLKAAQVFQAGAQVKVLAGGAGFEIASSAQTLSVGVVGQNAKVRMDNGRVVSGTVIDQRTVRIDL